MHTGMQHHHALMIEGLRRTMDRWTFVGWQRVAVAAAGAADTRALALPARAAGHT